MDLLTDEAMNGLVLVGVGRVKVCPPLDVAASDRTTVKVSSDQSQKRPATVAFLALFN
jgi:hypothetical protein